MRIPQGFVATYMNISQIAIVQDVRKAAAAAAETEQTLKASSSRGCIMIIENITHHNG